ncbi:MAG: Clostripain family protein [Clostridia bacterium]|nr:Clostripain family protein [Clostridia bacterium]
MKMKVLAIILAAAMTLCLAACGSGSDSDKSGALDTSSLSAKGLNMSLNRSTGKLTVDRPAGAQGDRMGEAGTWTIFVYLCGTDLESRYGMGTNDLQEMLNAEGSDSVRFVVQTGGAERWRNDIVENGKIQRFLVQDGELYALDEGPSANMGDVETFYDFISWGVENYASEHMGVILWNHGGGSITGICFDEQNEFDSLSLKDLDGAFAAVYENMTQKFDFIGFDACLMGTLETANVLASYADYMYGSEESEPGYGWDYTVIGTYLARNPDADAASLGKVVCDSFYKSCEDIGQERGATLAVIDLSYMDELVADFNAFAQSMYESAENPDALVCMVRGIEGAENFGGNNKSEGYTNMVDLGALVSACAPYTDGADAVLNSLDNAVVYSIAGSTHKNASGLSLYYPLSVQGSEELTIFGGVCVSPYYLSFIDRQNYGSVNQGSTAGYSDDYWYDEDGNWSWASAGAGDSEYWEYADSFEITGESPLITFEQEPILDDEGDFWFILDDSGYYYAANVYGYVYELSEDGEDLIELGETYDIIIDWDNGFFCDDFDGYWMSLPDGQNLATYIVEVTDDAIIYTSPVFLNDEQTNLRLRQTFDGDITIEGAWAGIDENGMAAKDIVQLKEGDKIVPIYYSYAVNSDDEGYYYGGEYVFEGTPEIYYDVMESADYLFAFCIDDIYGDYYLSEFVMFNVEENGDVYYYEW